VCPQHQRKTAARQRKTAAPARPQLPLPSSRSAVVPVTGSDPSCASRNITNQSSVPEPPPLANLHERSNKKRKRLTEANVSEAQQQTEAELLKLTKAQLVIQARKGSKRSISDDDRDFFANFRHRQRKLLIIKAIERGVSMPMVYGYL
jgi:hypothetical protein